MDILLIVGGFLLAWILFQCISCLAISNKSSNKKIPSGPIPLPLIGNLHNVFGGLPHQSLAKLADKYGPIFSLRMGQVKTVVISSSAIAKQVLQKQDVLFASRPIPDAIQAQNHSQSSVVWLPLDSQWRSLRKILNTNIFSGNRLDANQHLRSQKVQELIAYCRRCSQTGEAVNIGQAAFDTSLNLLSNTLFSKDVVDPCAKSGKEFKDVVWKIMEEAVKPNLADFFPVLKLIDPQGIRRRIAKYFATLLLQIDRLIDERLEQRSKLQTSGNTDVLDVLLNTSQEDPMEIDRNLIQGLCLDLFVGGTDTSSNTLEWAMAETVKHPDIMKKAKDELAQVIGKGKIIEEVDIHRLPYLQCIVKETLRLHATVPFLFRKANQDIKACGYIFSKDTHVTINLWSIGRDPAVWENPLEFKPERFLGSAMDFRGKDFELIPFGAGRRICPGIPLATRTVPVMLGSLLNTFDWETEGSQDLDMEEMYGLTLAKSRPLRLVPIPL